MKQRNDQRTSIGIGHRQVPVPYVLLLECLADGCQALDSKLTTLEPVQRH